MHTRPISRAHLENSYTAGYSHSGQKSVHETRFQMQQAELAALRETDHRRQAQMVETLRVIRDMRREMSDMHAELLALREELKAVSSVGLVWIEKMESVFNISGLCLLRIKNVKSARPKMLDETIELANDLMDQKLRTYAEKKGSLDNKRSTGNTNVANAQKGNGAAPKGNVGNAEKRGNASGNPDANVVMAQEYLAKKDATLLFGVDIAKGQKRRTSRMETNKGRTNRLRFS
ncbi:hypothetical protein Tco_1359363 [Tanacetum coccineum]